MRLSPVKKMRFILGNVLLYAIRIVFFVGRWVSPETTLARASRLFCTPFSNSRAKAERASQAGACEERLTINGIVIASYVWGDLHKQPYVLFAHGWSSHGTRIAPWVEPLRAAGYAVVAFDQVGHGRSGGHRTTLPDFASILLEVGRHYGPAAAVVGHSLGAAATTLALARGLAVERAILIAPSADPLAAMERFSHFLWLGRDFGRRIATFLEGQTRVTLEELQVQHTAPHIARPALIVHDLEDREVPWSEGERYARLWNGARMITTRGFGHNRIAENPKVIDDALRFLRCEPVGERIISSPNLPFGVC